MDFFEFTSQNQWRLSKGEQSLLDYVVRNLGRVKSMSIRELAGACFVSTTTVFRFVKKLGFDGYADFHACLRQTDAARPAPQIPERMFRGDYSENYLKNIIETVRVIGADKCEEFARILATGPTVYILAEGFSKEVGHYVHYLFTNLGIATVLPIEPYEYRAFPRQIHDGDLLLVFSYSGENTFVLDIMERVLAVKKPKVVTVTSAESNSVFAHADLDIYVFSDLASFGGNDITSRIAMIAAVEFLLTYYLRERATAEAASSVLLEK